MKKLIFLPSVSSTWWFWLPAGTEAVWKERRGRRSQILAVGVVIHLGEASVRHHHPSQADDYPRGAVNILIFLGSSDRTDVKSSGI